MDRDRETPRVLVSAYACGPHWGSEIGMGWNWVAHLARYCQLAVITEAEFRREIEEAIAGLDVQYKPDFHFIDIGETARRRCWNQGDWRFYRDYQRWQQNALRLAGEITSRRSFDLVHQLNMIGYREPGYLWKLPLPFIWGPVGGHAQFPWRFMAMLGMRAAAYYSLRNVLNSIQMRYSSRVQEACKKAKVIVAATENDRDAILRVHGRDSIVISETGSTISDAENRRHGAAASEKIKLVWNGMFQGRKALPIVLHALSGFKDTARIELHIIGDGPERATWKNIADSLGVSHMCRWYGRIEHEKALEVMRQSDVLIFSSLLEATSTVVLEALQNGLPVICHDACGFGTVIDATCGIKVPVLSPAESARGFTNAIHQIAGDPALLSRLRDGAFRRAQELTWDRRARQMVDIYRGL